MVVVNTIIKNNIDTIDDSRYFINPVIYSDVSISSLNKRVYKKFKGLRVKIKDTLVYYSKRRFSKLKIRLRPYVIVNNDTRKPVFVLNLVIGKDKPNISYLKESLNRLYWVGRDSGFYSITIDLCNDAYMTIENRQVIKAYLNIFKSYPGILNFIVKDDDTKKVIQKEMKKLNIR